MIDSLHRPPPVDVRGSEIENHRNVHDIPKTALLLVLSWRESGGIEAVVRDVRRALLDLGWSVKVISVFDPDDRQTTSSRECEGLCPRGRIRRSIWHRFRWRSTVAGHVRRHLANGGLLILGHANLLPLARSAPKSPLIRTLTWVYGIEVWGRFARKWAASLNSVDRVIAISRFTASEIRRGGVIKPATVVPCCVNVSEFVPTATPERIRRDEILICGRMASSSRDKGHEVLFQSLKIAERDLGRRLSIRVVGEGSDRPRLQEVTRQLGISDRVIFTGRVALPTLLEAYQHCGLFCMPSRVELQENGDWTGEGFGIVYLEAAACGRPVIASSEGGAPETVIPGESGLTVDPRSPTAVARAIVSVFSDPDLADCMGRNGRALAVDHFSHEHFVRNVQMLVTDAIGHSGTDPEPSLSA